MLLDETAHLAFVRRPPKVVTLDFPEWVSLLAYWEKATLQTGSVSSDFLSALTSRCDSLEETRRQIIGSMANGAITPSQRWSRAPTGDDVRRLEGILLWDDAVDCCAELQRQMKEKLAFSDYFSALQHSPSPALASMPPQTRLFWAVG